MVVELTIPVVLNTTSINGTPITWSQTLIILLQLLQLLPIITLHHLKEDVILYTLIQQ